MASKFLNFFCHFSASLMQNIELNEEKHNFIRNSSIRNFYSTFYQLQYRTEDKASRSIAQSSQLQFLQFAIARYCNLLFENVIVNCMKQLIFASAITRNCILIRDREQKLAYFCNCNRKELYFNWSPGP